MCLKVLVDINWRPVFWEDECSAIAAIKPYVGKADIVKMSDEEAEWLFGIPAQDALQHPLKACAAPLRTLLPCSMHVPQCIQMLLPYTSLCAHHHHSVKEIL